ncbi:VWA domain-containing protein [Luedemannella helvata]|uniref:VWA domain-containing protein n=1 Tax=Luedemannella helvata TaxID=349315 RepID=A0ABP4X9G3_9ACTN
MSRLSVPPRQASGRRAGAAALAFVLATITALGVPAPARAADGEATEQDVYETLEIGDVPIHFEVLIDTSTTMFKGGRFSSSRRSLLALIGALGPNDTINITTFADSPGDCYSGTLIDPQDMVSCLPAADEGESSNLARPLLTAFGDMREEKAPVSALIVMSDIDRKSNDLTDRTDPLWKTLKPASNVEGLRVFGSTAGGVSSTRALRSVFGKVEAINITKTDQAKKFYDKMRSDLQVSRLRTVLKPDLAASVSLTWDHSLDGVDPAAGNASQMITLESKTSNLPLVLTGVTLQRVEGDETVTVAKLPERIELVPNTPAYYYVQFEWPTKPWFRLSSEKMAVHASFALHAEVSSPWDAVLAKHHLKRATKLEGPQTIAVNGETTLNPPYFQMVLLLIGAATLVLLLVVVVRKLNDWRGAHRRA